MSTMPHDDEEVRAIENRLRQSGWTDRPIAGRPRPIKRGKIAPPPTRFGGLDGQIKAAAQTLVAGFDGYFWPTYGEISTAFGFSYDDAVRVLGEAKRLAGVQA